MTSLFEGGTAERQKNMEGVNMPASPKLAWRWIVGTTAAAMLCLAMLPSVGHAETLTICVNGNGKIKGVNVSCNGTSLTWETVGPQGDQGPTGVDGPPGHAGPQGAAGGPGIQGPSGAQGAFGPTGDPGAAGVIGDQGVQGIQGNPGIQGIPGLKGITGIPGFNGGTEHNKTFLTGGTLGTFGGVGHEGIELSGLRVVNSKLFLGPGNAADTTVNAGITPKNDVAVPMTDPGNAYNLFVRVDNHPGINPAGGPISFFFQLCKNDATVDANCTPVLCTITDPDTNCKDTVDFVTLAGDKLPYVAGDFMTLRAFTDDSTANAANVAWSVTYDHASFVSP